jgi:hypothetical protein
MHPSSQVKTFPPAEMSRWVLGPSHSRAESIDLSLRERLGKSLDYVVQVSRERDNAELVGLDNLQRRLKEGPVSPWVFCLYSKLVAELSRQSAGDVAGVFHDLVQAASLPSDQGIMPFKDAAVSDSWWDHFQVLLDTDRRRRFKLQVPDTSTYIQCETQIKEGLARLQELDLALIEELRSLLRTIVLGAPETPSEGYNGASTFFFWGGALLNAAVSRSAISIVDLLVHESSHVLLFGLSGEGPLTRNSGEERYASPVRPDKRPIDGIFHACFVTTRVHLAMTRLLEGGSLSARETSEVEERLLYNGSAGRESLELLQQHAVLTECGERILGELRNYWHAASGQ